MRPLVLLAWLLAALAGPAAAQESVVTGLSADEIALTARFEGSQLFLFGAVRRDGQVPEESGPLDIIITLKGPERNVMVRQKARWFGLWVNRGAVEVRQAPSFYAVATTAPLDDILSQTAQLRYGIGMDQAVRRVGGALTDTAPYAEALVRLKEANGSYVQADGQVKIAEETLFQTKIEMPANLVEGNYAAEFFLVRDFGVVNHGEALIRVEKTGIERWLYNLSVEEPLAYGIGAVALALLAGWLANAVFRFGRR